MYQDIIKELGDKVKARETTWKEAAEEFNKQTGLNINGEALRKRYSNNKDSGLSSEKTNEEYETHYQNGTVELQKTIFFDPNEEKTPDVILKKFGYKPSEWELVEFRFGKWEVAIKAEDQNRLCTTIRAKIKPRTKEISTEDALKVIEDVFKGKIAPLNIPKKENNTELNKNLLLVLTAIEAHLGKLADETYTGATYDHHIVQARVLQVLEETVQVQRQEKCDSAVVVIGGDFFNSESNGQTTNGTPQINDTRPNKMFEIGCELYKIVLLTLREEFNHIEVKLTAGNHARNMEGMLYTALKMKFENDNVIEFKTENPNTNAYKWGEVALFFNHGDPKEKRLHPSMAAGFPEIWGNTKYRFLLSQHLHIRKMLIDENGMTCIRTPSICENDEWHEINRFGIGVIPQQQIMIFHREKGLVTDHFINFEETKKKSKQKIKKLDVRL